MKFRLLWVYFLSENFAERNLNIKTAEEAMVMVNDKPIAAYCQTVLFSWPFQIPSSFLRPSKDVCLFLVCDESAWLLCWLIPRKIHYSGDIVR